jgi:hypothetical protein
VALEPFLKRLRNLKSMDNKQANTLQMLGFPVFPIFPSQLDDWNVFIYVLYTLKSLLFDTEGDS